MYGFFERRTCIRRIVVAQLQFPKGHQRVLMRWRQCDGLFISRTRRIRVVLAGFQLAEQLLHVRILWRVLRCFQEMLACLLRASFVHRFRALIDFLERIHRDERSRTVGGFRGRMQIDV